MKKNPHALTAHLACGGVLDGAEAAWVAENLAVLRKDGFGSPALPLIELNKIYMTARVIQGGIVAARVALPATIAAGQIVRDAVLSDNIGEFAKVGSARTEIFLSGSENGKPRRGNDYPEVIKKYIAAIAGVLKAPYASAYKVLEEARPDLLTLAQDADELQRRCWAHVRWLINNVISAEEIATFRAKPLRKGTDQLLAFIKERTGARVPARIMQRDNWLDAIQSPRQERHIVVFNELRFFVEIAEVALLYLLGSLLARMKLSKSRVSIFADHIRFAVQEIAIGTHTVTHNARFQSRIGARPNDYRSFNEFLRNVREQTSSASLQADGRIAWSDARAEHGWCPAQNLYEPESAGGLTDLAERGNDAVRVWKDYARRMHGIEPLFVKPSPAELFGAVVLFASIHTNSPLLPESGLILDLADKVSG